MNICVLYNITYLYSKIYYINLFITVQYIIIYTL